MLIQISDMYANVLIARSGLNITIMNIVHEMLVNAGPKTKVVYKGFCFTRLEIWGETILSKNSIGNNRDLGNIIINISSRVLIGFSMIWSAFEFPNQACLWGSCS